MRSDEDRIELANAFVYTVRQQDEIVALMRPLHMSTLDFDFVDKPRLAARHNDVSGIPASPEETCIQCVTRIARCGLVAFLEPRRTAKGEKERYRRYVAALERAARELEAALPLRRVDGGIRFDHYGPGPFLFLADWEERRDAGDPSLSDSAFVEPRALAAALRHHAAVAERVLDVIDAGYAANFVAASHNPNRWWLAFNLLDRQVVETGIRPRRSRTGAAARLLLAALDPVMIYGSRIVEIRDACPLLNAENAEYIIRRWEPLRAEQGQGQEQAIDDIAGLFRLAETPRQ